MQDGRCAYARCTLGPGVTTDPCIVCGSGVHHICANEVYSGSLSKRLCSARCKSIFKKTGTLSESEDEESKTESDPQESPVDLAQSAMATQASSHARSANELSTPTSTLNDLGIPTSVTYSRQKGRSQVWDYLRKLDKPIKHKKTKCTHLCILCADDLFNRPSRNANSWMNALCRTQHSSNGWKHLKGQHPTHPIVASKQEEDTKKSANSILSDEIEIQSALGKRSAPSDSYPEDQSASMSPAPVAKFPGGYRTIAHHFRPTSRQIGTLVFQWLVSDGHPYNYVATPAFKKMMSGAVGNPNITILSRDRYNSLLDGEFSLFAKSVQLLLQKELKEAFGEPFLNVLHDIWTNANSCGIVGVTVAFIDSSWNWRYIAVLATEKNDGHASQSVSGIIRRRTTEIYGVDVFDLALYTVSDTTNSARKVATYFENTKQSDCCMHMLNLCISYGIGMKDNTRTDNVLEKETGSWLKIVRVVTPGGPMPEGREAITKLRKLNNFFCSSARLSELEATQKASSTPQLRPKQDVDVRVASTCELMRRSMLNFTAYKIYFHSHPGGDVLQAISEEEWRFVAEMEAVTNYLSELALTEVQHEQLLASYMLVFRKAAEKKLTSTHFNVYDFSVPDADCNDRTIPRVPTSVEDFSAQGRRCIERTLAQLRERFPPIDGDAAFTLLLDPRTKNCVREIIAGMASTADHIEAIMFQAVTRFKEEHFRLSKIASRQNGERSGHQCDDSDDDDDSDSGIDSDDEEQKVGEAEDEFVFGAPIPASDQSVIEDAQLRVESDAAVDMWLARQEKWVQVAHTQQGGGISKKRLKKKMRVSRSTPGQSGPGSSKICWSLLALYEYVDIQRWFREVATKDFPIIATLARLHLGKVSSTAFQERVFSSGSFIMNELRTQTDPNRAEKQLLLKHNSKEIEKMGRPPQ